MPAKKGKTLVQVLASPVVLAVEKAVRDVYNSYPGQKIVGRHHTCDAVELAVDIFLNGKVVDADIVMYEKTPMVKVDIRHRGKTRRINKAEPLRHLLAVVGASGPLNEALAKALLPLLPQDQVAMQVASIENAAAAALADPAKRDPIIERLRLKRAADKERLMLRIREVFKDHDKLLTEEEVLQLWREGLVAEVMDS
ncbi:MAG: hypothetical protein ACRD6W_00700 [Nitrososphaerales archaeon]